MTASAHPSTSLSADLAASLAAIDVPDDAIKQIITCTIEGALEPEDIHLFLGEALPAQPMTTDADGNVVSLPPRAPLPADELFDVQRIRERHHSVARLVASGLQHSVVAKITRYTEAYLSVLLKAPAMRELIGHYKTRHDAAAGIVGEQLRTLSMTSVEELQRRINDAPDSVATSELTAIAKLGLDRSGHGPSSSKQIKHEHHVVDYAELRRLNEEARNEQAFIDPTEALALRAPVDAEVSDVEEEE